MSSHALLPVLTFMALKNKIQVRLGRTPYAKDFTYLQDDSKAILVTKTKLN